MARRSGFHPRGQRSSGVARDWGAGVGGSALTTIVTSSSVVLGSGVQTTGSELTLLRTRGICDLFLQGSGAADGDGMFGAIGIGVFTDPAFIAGVGSLPTPVTDVEWNGWLWHSFFSVHNPDITFGGSPVVHQRFEIDSKAMRKFDASQVMAAVIETVEIGTAVLNVFMDTRILFQDSGR